MDEYATLSHSDLAGLAYLDTEPYVWGNVSLLSEPSIGICGSRKASHRGLTHALELGKLAAQFGLVVISGYAGGVDEQAHVGAASAGGSTVAVLAEGIRRFRVRRSLRDKITGRNFLALSVFDPDAPWAPWRAMQRNKTIVRLAKAMFVVEAGETGGTIDAGRVALSEGTPLFVLEFSTERPQTRGNSVLLELGATPVPNLKSLRAALDQIRCGEAASVGRLL
jgi:DNA processing protein